MLLIWGFNAVGRVLIDNSLDTTSGELLLRLPIPIGLKFPLRVESHHLQELDLLLPPVASRSKVGTARRVALHWFYRGESTESPADQVLAYFVAIEAIVTAETEGLSEDPQRRAFRKRVLASLKTVLADSERDTVANALAGVTLAERFASFASSRNLPVELNDEFTKVAKARNDIFHGRLPRVGTELAVAARLLAERVLKASLGLLDGEVGRPVGPAVRSIDVMMTLRPATKPDASAANADEMPRVREDI